MIERGPRLAALTDAVAGAISVLREPLDDEARELGWTDAHLESALAALERYADRLAHDPSAALEDVDLDFVDAPAEDPRCDAVDVVAYLADDLGLASECLDASTEFLTWLDGDGELPAEVRSDVAAAAGGLREALESGEYLGDAVTGAWFGALERHGFERVSGSPTMADPSFGLRIVDWPKGRAYERIVVLDHLLAPVIQRDRLTLDGDAA